MKINIKQILNSKKAMTRRTIIILVLVITGFVIVLGFTLYMFYGLEGLTEDQLCHEQILARHTFNIQTSYGGINIGKRYVPLTSCQASHVCFVTSRNQECPELQGFDDIEKIIVSTEEDIIIELVDRKFRCWGMVGAGDLDYQPSGEYTDWTKRYCGICAKIFFSNEARGEFGKISFENYLKYQDKYPVPNLDISYTEYFYGKGVSSEMIRDKFIEKDENKHDIYKDEIDLKYGYALVTSINKKGWLQEISKGVIISSLNTFFGPAGLVFGLTTLYYGGDYLFGDVLEGTILYDTNGKVYGYFLEIQGDIQIKKDNKENGDLLDFSPPELIVYDTEHLKVIEELGCDSFDFLA